MSAPLRVALVGYGLAGKTFHAPLIATTDGLALTTVVSSDAKKVLADHPEVKVVADYPDTLLDDAIDLVVIATPDHLHAEQVIAALDANKHVVVDKPFAPTLQQALMILARADASDRILAIFQNRRWDADFLTLQRLIAEGVLGDVVEYESHFDRFRPELTDRWKDKRGAGVWQDLGPHLVDQAIELFGMPEAVYANLCTQKRGGLAPDYAHVLLRYPGLRVILHMSQLTAANGLRFAVHGTAGSYIKHGLDPQEDQSKAGLCPSDADWGIDRKRGTFARVDQDGLMHESQIENERGNYLAFYEGVRDAISGKGANPVPPRQALDVIKVIEAGCVSATERREVVLSASNLI